MPHTESTTTPHGEAVMEVLREVRAFSDAIDRMHADMKSGMQMNSTDLAALRMLIMREHRGLSVSPHQLASHLRISTASTTKLLDRLTASGHVERQPHPRDGRARVVVLTDESRRIFFRHFGQHLANMRDVADGFHDDELVVISRFLAEVSRVLDPE